EQRWVLGQLRPHLLDVAAVVEAQAKDLRRAGDDGRQVDVSDGDRRPCLTDAFDARVQHGGDVGRVEGHDAVTVEAAGARAAGGPHGDETHGGQPVTATAEGGVGPGGIEPPTDGL